MSIKWQSEKNLIVQGVKQITKLGLSLPTNGNVSIRLKEQGSPDLIAITPTRKNSLNLVEDDITIINFDAESLKEDQIPSTESLMHIAIYKIRPDINAVIHAHSTYASVAAITGIEIPPVLDEMVISIGGTISLSPYAFPGSEKLAQNISQSLTDKNSALLQNHGAVAIGRNLAEAIDICVLTEKVAEIFIKALQVGKINELPLEVVEAEKSIYRMQRQQRST